MKKEDLIRQVDKQIGAISWLDTADLEGELDVHFGSAERDQIAEWVREFALTQLRKLREWANDQKD